MMGIGFALGGIAKGISDQQELGMKNNALALQTQELKSNDAYRNASLGLEQKRLAATTALEGQSKALQIYNGMQQLLTTAVAGSLKNGTDPNTIANSTPIKAIIGQMQSIATAAGLDPSAPVNALGTILQSGNPAPSSVGDVMAPVIAKFQKGGMSALSNTEQFMVKQWLKSVNIGQAAQEGAIQSVAPDLVPPDTMVPAGGAPGPAATAPAAAPAPAPAGAPAKAPPPIPKGLVGKNPHWSPSEPQFFFLPDGTITDLQGTPVGKMNAAAQ